MLKHLLLTWFICVVSTFILYDVAWLLIDYVEFGLYFFHQLNWSFLLIDGFLCCLFGFVCTSIDYFISRTDCKQHFQSNHLFMAKVCVFTILINFAIVTIFGYALLLLKITIYEGNFFKDLYYFTLVATSVSMVLLVIRCNHIIVNIMEEKVRLRKQLLNMQFDPHFLFNSLSILSELIVTKPAQAETFTLRLAKVYRYILHNKKDVTSVCESVNFIYDYVELIKCRFSNSIYLMVSDEVKECRGYLPSMSLQIAVENAIKHNMPQKKECLNIYITKSKNNILVQNSLCINGGRNLIESMGIGLSNLKEIYLLLCKFSPEISQTDELFEIKLPIIK